MTWSETRCGRPTATGKPCRQFISPLDRACRIHLTPHDEEVIAAHHKGIELGRELERSDLQFKIKQQIQQQVAKELAGRPCIHFKLHNRDGYQIVVVDGYTYLWVGEGELTVGDKVWLPPAYWEPRHASDREGTVTALGSDYSGDLVCIQRRCILGA